MIVKGKIEIQRTVFKALLDFTSYDLLYNCLIDITTNLCVSSVLETGLGFETSFFVVFIVVFLTAIATYNYQGLT